MLSCFRESAAFEAFEFVAARTVPANETERNNKDLKITKILLPLLYHLHPNNDCRVRCPPPHTHTASFAAFVSAPEWSF